MQSKRSPSPGPESLEARLRALPPPPVPSGLEGRLLATIPVSARLNSRQSQAPRPRWVVWAGLAGALAAASILAFLFWPKVNREDSNGIEKRFIKHDTPQRANDSPDMDQVIIARRVEDDAVVSPFNWPIEETTPLTA